MITHRQLRYFVEIVDAGSFSLAAERLYVAQSALSRQIREMERDLQVRLLERDTRHLEMTAAGRSLYSDARRILLDLEHAASHAIHAERGTEGTLQLHHSSSVPINGRIMELMQKHVRLHPLVSIEISQTSSEHQALEVYERRADVGLARSPVLRRYDGVHYESLFDEPLLIAIAADHPLAKHPSADIASLREMPFVSVPHRERGGLSHHVATLCRKHGFDPVAAQVRSRKVSQLALVEAGFGVAIVPESMSRMAPDGVRLLALDGEDCVSTVMAVWRDDAPPIVQQFVGELKSMRAAQSAA